MLTFKEYKDKYCKGFGNAPARKMYCMYCEASIGSTDFAQKEINTMATFQMSSGMNSTYCILDEMVKLASLPQACNQMPCMKPEPKKAGLPCPQKGNNPMFVDNDKHIESSKINYLNERAYQIQFVKDRDLEKKFGLVNDAKPNSAKELVDRILAGKYVLPDGDAALKHNYEPSNAITWRDPAVKKDKAGYDAADVLLQKAFQDVKDTIAIGTPTDGLAAVKTLDAWTLPVTPAA